MTEGVPISQEPAELNHRLLALYDLLPDRDTRFMMDPPTPIQESLGLSGLGRFIKPDASEMKDKIMSGVRELLAQAHITPAFKDIVMELFEQMCDVGTWKSERDEDHEEFIRLMWGDRVAEESERDFIYDSVIRTSQDGGGIFDPSDSMRIERIAYRLDFIGQLASNEAMARLYRNFRRQGEYKLDPSSDRARRIQKWRQEFIERYHEEP